jgi:hypothetical protein
MRTTLDIDDDVLQAAKEHARRDKKTVGEVISELARSALSLDGFRPFPKRGGIVSNGLIDKLREEDPY